MNVHPAVTSASFTRRLSIVRNVLILFPDDDDAHILVSFFQCDKYKKVLQTIFFPFNKEKCGILSTQAAVEELSLNKTN